MSVRGLPIAADGSAEAAWSLVAGHAQIALGAGTLFVELDCVSRDAERLLEQTLTAAAQAAGLADWIVGPFRLAKCNPPKCYGRLVYNREFPERLDEQFARAARTLAELLREAGFDVRVVEASARSNTAPPSECPLWPRLMTAAGGMPTEETPSR